MIAVLVILAAVLAALASCCEYFLRFALRSGARPLVPGDGSPFSSEQYRHERELSRGFLEKECTHVYMTSRDGLTLHGYLHEKAGCHDYLVTVHGYRGCALDNGALYRYMASEGFSTLVVDVRGHGESGGRWLSMGLWEADDLALWVDFIVSKDPAARIALHGVSMGGATVMMLSGRNPAHVKAIVEDCGYSSTYDEFACQMKAMFHLPAHPLLDIISLWCRFRLGFSFKDVTPKNEVTKTRIPMMFIHGDADTFVPFAMVYENRDAHRGEHELWVAEGVVHGAGMIVLEDEYRRRVAAFIRKYIPRS